MQITIEDLSPVKKVVEFELPWADVAPKLEKAYDALRRGVELPGFRPGKVPRALLEKMYRRQAEDDVAAVLARKMARPRGRDGRRPRPGQPLARPGDPRESDPAGGAADRRGSEDRV